MVAIVSMEAPTTTVQLRRATAERLNALKVPGLTYDDVINFALDHVPPEEIRKLFDRWQDEALAKLKTSDRVKPGKGTKARK